MCVLDIENNDQQDHEGELYKENDESKTDLILP